MGQPVSRFKDLIGTGRYCAANPWCLATLVCLWSLRMRLPLFSSRLFGGGGAFTMNRRRFRFEICGKCYGKGNHFVIDFNHQESGSLALMPSPPQVPQPSRNVSRSLGLSASTAARFSDLKSAARTSSSANASAIALLWSYTAR